VTGDGPDPTGGLGDRNRWRDTTAAGWVVKALGRPVIDEDPVMLRAAEDAARAARAGDPRAAADVGYLTARARLSRDHRLVVGDGGPGSDEAVDALLHRMALTRRLLTEPSGRSDAPGRPSEFFGGDGGAWTCWRGVSWLSRRGWARPARSSDELPGLRT
jgi:hypothetical protein